MELIDRFLASYTDRLTNATPGRGQSAGMLADGGHVGGLADREAASEVRHFSTNVTVRG